MDQIFHCKVFQWSASPAIWIEFIWIWRTDFVASPLPLRCAVTETVFWVFSSSCLCVWRLFGLTSSRSRPHYHTNTLNNHNPKCAKKNHPKRTKHTHTDGLCARNQEPNLSQQFFYRRFGVCMRQGYARLLASTARAFQIICIYIHTMCTFTHTHICEKKQPKSNGHTHAFNIWIKPKYKR